MSLLSVVFRVLNQAGTAFIEPATADKQLPDNHQVQVSNFPATQVVRDSYASGEILADQTAGGTALTFNFAAPVQLIYVQVKTALGTGSGRADPFGGTPTASSGIPCDDGVPQAIPVQSSSVKVFATTGATVSVWGYRY
jgi:hypothetical protein